MVIGVKEAIVEKLPPTGITEKLVVPPQLTVMAIQTCTVIVYVPFPLLIGAEGSVIYV
jgi:hypothetical protein